MKQDGLKMFLKCCLAIQSRMSIDNEFQADGAETAKALSVNRRRVRGVLKSPLDLERSRLSVHGLHSSHNRTHSNREREQRRETQNTHTTIDYTNFIPRRSLRFSGVPRRFPKDESSGNTGLLMLDFYRPDALPVTQPSSVSKVNSDSAIV